MNQRQKDKSDYPYESDYEAVERVTVPALDNVLGKAFRVLDQGFVRVVDYMGGDSSVVQAARVSYGSGTKTVRADRGLIRYLMRSDPPHSTPFEMADIKLHVRVPMDCWRQWVRHRTASVNEYSTRYSLAIDDKQITKPSEWRTQSKSNKQGSGSSIPIETGVVLSDTEATFHSAAAKLYEQRIAAGVAREQARKDLPLSTYTEAYWKCNLWNLLHFLRLRMDSHAQEEIRNYATVIGEEIVARWVPEVWSAFQDYHQNRVALTAVEQELLRRKLTDDSPEQYALQENLIATNIDGDAIVYEYSREMNEYLLKLEALGFTSWNQPGV